MIVFTHFDFGVTAFITIVATMSLGASIGYFVGRYARHGDEPKQLPAR